MSKEKKPSKDEHFYFNKQRRRKVLDWTESWKQNLPFKAYQDLLAILKKTPEIEAQAEPSEERIRTRGAGWGRGRGGEGITNKEPSEAELGEFVEKWADIVTPVVLINNKMRPQLMKAMQKDLINMLKEYNELRRG